MSDDNDNLVLGETEEGFVLLLFLYVHFLLDQKPFDCAQDKPRQKSQDDLVR